MTKKQTLMCQAKQGTVSAFRYSWLLICFRFLEFVNNPAYERDTLHEAMNAFGIAKLDDSICPWISPHVVLKPHQLIAVHWMILKAAGEIHGGILGDDCGLGKVTRIHCYLVAGTKSSRTDNSNLCFPHMVDVQYTYARRSYKNPSDWI